jgi:CheY-like chemotaxis protein
MDIMRLEALKKGLKLTVNTECLNIERVIGDKQRYQQIFTNLLGNAIKFTDFGEVLFSIASRIDPDGRHIVIEGEVKDSGIGIPKTHLDAIFKPFEQAKSGSAQIYGGCGLGLAISRSICEALKGKIWVHETSDNGTIFRFTLRSPNEESDTGMLPHGLTTDGSVEPTRVEDRPPPRRTNKRVLVVDDNEINRNLALVMLKNLGFSATPVASSSEALEILKTDDFGIVLLDILMPEFDGFAVTKVLRSGSCGENSRQAQIIAVTALAMTGDREKCLEAGMDDYITKPISMKDLARALRAVVN